MTSFPTYQCGLNAPGSGAGQKQEGCNAPPSPALTGYYALRGKRYTPATARERSHGSVWQKSIRRVGGRGQQYRPTQMLCCSAALREQQGAEPLAKRQERCVNCQLGTDTVYPVPERTALRHECGFRPIAMSRSASVPYSIPSRFPYRATSMNPARSIRSRSSRPE